MTELETIIANLNTAVNSGEITEEQAIDLLDAMQDHEFEASASLSELGAAYYGEAV